MSNIPLLIQGVGFVLVALLIPIWISLFRDKKDFKELDEQILINYILERKAFLLFLGLIIIPPLLWGIPSLGLKFLIVLLSGIGIICIFRNISRAFTWISGNKFNLRYDYLDKLEDNELMEKVWASVWETQDLNIKNEESFLDIFYVTIDNLIEDGEKESFNSVVKLLGNFKNNLDNRDIFNIIIREKNFIIQLFYYYNKFNEIHFKNRDWFYEKISNDLESIVKSTQEFLFKKKELIGFLKVFKQHVEKVKVEKDKSAEEIKGYLNHIFDIFLPKFFDEIINYRDRGGIWERLFHNEWKITKSNLIDYEKEKNIIVGIILDKFEKWAVPRILTITEEIDENMDDVVRYLFSEVNHILWSKILIFKYTPKPPQYKVLPVIERPWNFGMGGRGKVYWESSKEGEKEIKNTFELALTLYPREFSRENIDVYIKEIQTLKGEYEKDSQEEHHRKELLEIFERMLKIVNSN